MGFKVIRLLRSWCLGEGLVGVAELSRRSGWKIRRDFLGVFVLGFQDSWLFLTVIYCHAFIVQLLLIENASKNGFERFYDNHKCGAITVVLRRSEEYKYRHQLRLVRRRFLTLLDRTQEAAQFDIVLL